MKRTYHSAEIVRTASGRQYHIGLAPGEVAPFVLLCGDPNRAERTAQFFDSVRLQKRCREFVTFTGRYHGIDVSVMGTGIGPDNMEIAVVEVSQVAPEATLVRIGSCGALQKGIRIGDLVISTCAVRLENTTSYFVPESYPAVAHPEVVLALLAACARTGVRHHAGMTATAPGFYGAQARKVPGFTPRFPSLPEDLARWKVANFEMEVSALLVLAGLAGMRAGAVCAVYAQRYANRFIDEKTKRRAERDCIQAGLASIEELVRMDRERRRAGAALWHPGLASG